MTRIYHCIQIHIHVSLLLFWYPCMWLLHQLLLSPPPPSNNVQSDSLYSGPNDPNKWTCLGDQNKTDLYPHMLLFCFPEIITEVCVLCLDPVWFPVNILRSQLWSVALVVAVKHPLETQSVKCLSLSHSECPLVDLWSVTQLLSRPQSASEDGSWIWMSV